MGAVAAVVAMTVSGWVGRDGDGLFGARVSNLSPRVARTPFLVEDGDITMNLVIASRPGCDRCPVRAKLSSAGIGFVHIFSFLIFV